MTTISRRRMSPLSGNVLTFSEDATHEGRDTFYEALIEEVPAVLTDLAAFCEEARRKTETAHLAFAPAGTWPQIEPLGPCVAAWAARHQIAEPWVIVDAMGALLDANDEPGRPTVMRLLSTDVSETRRADAGTIGVGEVTITFAWQVASQPRDVFKSLMFASLERQFDAELDRIESEAAAAGAARYERRQLERHMRWLVRRVVRYERPTHIAEMTESPWGAAAPTTRTVELAIVAVADIIGLRIPQLPRGRPRKTGTCPHVVKNPRRAASPIDEEKDETE